jgi:SAM-dependent methyltransferase
MPIEDAYRDDLAYIHDTGHGNVARDAVARLLEELSRREHRAGTIVDVGCGSGILAQVVAEAGYSVLGIDVSDAMVALARRRVSDAEFRVASFVDARLPASVAVTAVGEVLSYAFDSTNDHGTRLDWFRRVYEALVPGGILLFDVAGPGRARPGQVHRSFATGSDWAVLAETSIDAATGILVRKITSFRQVENLYRRDAETHRLLLVDPDATLESLRAVGFDAEIIAAYGSTPLPPGVVAFLGRKPAGRAV